MVLWKNRVKNETSQLEYGGEGKRSKGLILPSRKKALGLFWKLGAQARGLHNLHVENARPPISPADVQLQLSPANPKQTAAAALCLQLLV